jgi:hypothetical protein
MGWPDRDLAALPCLPMPQGFPDAIIRMFDPRQLLLICRGMFYFLKRFRECRWS